MPEHLTTSEQPWSLLLMQSIFSTLHSCVAYWYCEFYVCSSYVFSFFFFFLVFSRATVSAVLQPCCTCYMLFVLLAHCVVCVLGK